MAASAKLRPLQNTTPHASMMFAGLLARTVLKVLSGLANAAPVNVHQRYNSPCRTELQHAECSQPLLLGQSASQTNMIVWVGSRSSS